MPIYALGDKVPSTPDDGDYWIAPNASVIGDVRLGQGASIWFGAVLRADNAPVIIGRNSNVQDNAVLHTDDGIPLQIGENVTVGHTAMIHGAVIGDESLIGIGAIVLNGANIGKHCLIGAGALVTEGMIIPDGSLALGSPAKVVRQLTPEQCAWLLHSADHYAGNWRRFKVGLKQIG
jgi:carbonic anhydrase/acetyltransferase-like protein (isoleucine patch superfamily)